MREPTVEPISYLGGGGSSDMLIRMNGLSQVGQLTAPDFLWLA